MLGALDMATVVTTALHLAEQGDPPLQEQEEMRVRRVLEAGLVVVYSRPFVGSRRGLNLPILKPKFASVEQRELHAETLTQRHRVYAHTDETEFRTLP
jgi:hypothetical protein